jgi:uncharacterized protein (DUF433 family)
MAKNITYPYIDKRSGVCGGRAVVKGTQIHEALAYAFDHLAEIQNDLKANRESTWQQRRPP